jgi:dihydrolipoamide dehydrogenase
VIGGGAIGLELGSVWARLGAKVTVIEMMPQIVPFADKQIATTLMRSLKNLGMEILLQTKVTGAEKKNGEVTVTYEDKKGEAGSIAGDKVLVAVGRRPYSSGAGLEEAGIEQDDRGFVKVDDHWRTNVEGVYAIGDLIARGPMLAHKGEEEGVAVAEIIAGKPGHVNYDAIPNIVYTWPELAQVGMTADEAKEKGYAVKEGKFFYRGNGRALTMDEADGLVKIVADADTDRVLGMHIVGARASDMLPEGVLALEFNATAEDIARTMHAHPTLSEIVKEAALAVDKQALHG